MHLTEEKRIYNGQADEVVCECLVVERQEIESTIMHINAVSVAQVRRECSAGGGCGGCHAEIARLILRHYWAEELDFDFVHSATSCSSYAYKLVDRVSVEQFLAQRINPKLLCFGVTALLSELEEELVLELVGADVELKYTLSFWLEAEFSRQFSPAMTIIIT